MAESTTQAVAVKIDQGTRERIKRLAESRKRTAHWVMKEAISQYLEREEKREAFRQDAIHAWNEYQATGLHVSGDEVTTWLKTWGDENELAAPECHK
jgi:predicted transcriptional regulator